MYQHEGPEDSSTCEDAIEKRGGEVSLARVRQHHDDIGPLRALGSDVDRPQQRAAAADAGEDPLFRCEPLGHCAALR